MADRRRHRGPHSDDAVLFAPEFVPLLRQAVADLSWLLTREYAQPSALKLVGDRYQLRERQRTAVMRCACSDHSLEARGSGRQQLADVIGASLAVDGFNLITTIEAALSGGVLIRGRDGCLRDMASMHGTYRRVEETEPALHLIGRTLSGLKVRNVHWILDRPVSNSGRLAKITEGVAELFGWDWTTELHHNPDRQLIEMDDVIVVSADSMVIEKSARWLDVASVVVEQIDADVLNLGAAR